MFTLKCLRNEEEIRKQQIKAFYFENKILIPSKKQNFPEIYFEFRHRTQKFIEIFQKSIEKVDSKKQLCRLICEQSVKGP